MAASTALPATAASCLLQPSRCRFTGAALAPSRRLFASSRRDGGSGTACSCSPEPPSAVPAERRGGGAGGQATSPKRTVRIVAVVGEGSVSPIKDTPWEEVMRHTADRLKWVDEGFEMLIFSDNLIDRDDLRKELVCCDMLVNVAVTSDESVRWLIKNSKDIPNIICFQSSTSLVNKLGGIYVEYTGEQDMFGKIASIGKPSGLKESAEILKTVTNAWERHNSDDIRFCLLVVVNAYIRPVDMLKNLRAKGLSTLSCMIKNCGPQILNCLFDPNCRKALQCLNSCSPTDQVCNYRCIASYESPHLEAFSLCVLQKHNCLDLNAEIPSKPSVTPLTMFRDQKLSHEIAEDLFVGWLDNMEWSWRVAAGQNPAYDQFPCLPVILQRES